MIFLLFWALTDTEILIAAVKRLFLLFCKVSVTIFPKIAYFITPKKECGGKLQQTAITVIEMRITFSEFASGRSISGLLAEPQQTIVILWIFCHRLMSNFVFSLLSHCIKGAICWNMCVSSLIYWKKTILVFAMWISPGSGWVLISEFQKPQSWNHELALNCIKYLL